MIFLFIFFDTNFNGRCVVTGQTDSFSLKINIATFLVFVLSAKYSVTPKYFLFKKFFFEIGPVTSLFVKPGLLS